MASWNASNYFCLFLLWAGADAFVGQKQHQSSRHLELVNTHAAPQPQQEQSTSDHERRNVISSVIAAASAVTTGLWGLGGTAFADEGGEDSFAAIAARANQISKDLDKENAATAANIRKSEKTIYDFTLPFEQKDIPFQDLIKQEFRDDGVKVKAILVVNIKQDDPIARRCIPELISLATKYGRNQEGALAVVCSPTDQGYYEPDTSALIRLKLASEYGYGINPATVATDKVNFLGTGAHPFWRWLEGTCRTPAGIGRIEGNFEKFLVDGLTGLPLRRYPRRYAPLNIADDIEAVIAGRPLNPARANYLEEWRSAAAEAERDTYRFEKGLNVFDQ
uniref:TPM domain-containing protein n=1 Tax=Entomoneis paludosa TaxID=265537 RepID=A0A7S2YFK7_9STRA